MVVDNEAGRVGVSSVDGGIRGGEYTLTIKNTPPGACNPLRH